MEFSLVYSDVAVEQIGQYATRTPHTHNTNSP